MSSSSNRSTSSSSQTSTSNSRSRRTERTTSRDSRADRSSRDRPPERVRPSDRDRDRESEGNQERRSYRALTAHERLPSGLPDWFTDKDENVNGQIEMAEYATSWTDAKVQEFAEYDLNNDGVITAVECLKSE